MNTPRVHLLMPVYNSFSYERSDGKKLLPLAIDSLLRQTFKNFELIILDNQSTDDTPAICKKYAEKDSRVRFIVDDQKRFAEAATSKLGNLATAPYCMIVNDDDMWDEKYIQEAVIYMDSHPETTMVYGKCLFFNPQNILVGKYIPKKDETYGPKMSKLERFIRYTNLRNILPIHYGLFRTEAFKKTLPYEDFDTLKSNVDNVFVSKFFALGYQADYFEKLLFFYRRKSRVLIPEKFAPNMPPLNNSIGVWLFYTHHQMLFFLKLCQIAKDQGFSENDMESIRSSILVSCMRNSLNLIRWVKQEIQSQSKFLEAINIEKLEKKYRNEIKPEKLTIKLFRDFINYASNEDVNETSKDFAFKILKILDTESVWYESNENASKKYLEMSKKPPFSLYNFIVEIIRDYPLLKKILMSILSVYLTIRFFPSYYRLIRNSKR